MADPPCHFDSRPHTTPRWVKVIVIIGIVLVLLVGILLLTGGGHGPGRHTSWGDTRVGPDRGWTTRAAADTTDRRGRGLAHG